MSDSGQSEVRLLHELWDATKKYMLHKNDTQARIKCDDLRMDVRMIYRQDVLNALAALDAVPAATPAAGAINKALHDKIDAHQKTLMEYVHFNSDKKAMAEIQGRIDGLREALDYINGVGGSK